MRLRRQTVLAAALSLLLPAVALAQDDDAATEDLDLTIRLIPQGASDGREISRTIALPDSVPERVPRTVPGESAAPDEAGAPGDDAPGREIADEARGGAPGRELGERLRERALEIREEAGRGAGPGPPDDPGPPDNPAPPDDPGPPDNPGPPGNPPGPGGPG